MKQILFLFALLIGVVTAANPASATQYWEEHVNLSFLANRVFAATGSCTPIYGGNQNNCPDTGIIMDKTVQNPQTNQFVDNLGINDPKFSPGDTVTFHLTVKNTSANTVNDIKVKDVLPDFVQYVSGTGSFDKSKNTLSYSISELKKDETRTVEVKATVFPSSQLPNQNNTCVVNQAIVTVANKNTQDNTQFCIQRTGTSGQNNLTFPSSTPSTSNTTKGGLPLATPTPPKSGATNTPTTKGGQPLYPQPSTTNTPSTGPEALGLLGLLPVGIGGIFLRKKA